MGWEKHLKLTPMQWRFAHAVAVRKMRPMAAAREAGYAGTKEAAYRLMRRPHIRKAIQLLSEGAEIPNPTDKPIVIPPDGLMEFWSEIINDPDIRTQDRIRASELLARAHGMLVDRRQVSGESGEPIPIRVEFVDA